MKDEIKEILDSIKYHIEEDDWFEIEGRFLKPLLDYITNLQEENEKLKEIVYNLTTLTVNGDRTQIKNTAQYKLEQCQQRIDKAIEYIEKEKEITEKYKFALSHIECDKVLSILRGEK